MIEPLLWGNAHVVYGSRSLNRKWAHGQPVESVRAWSSRAQYLLAILYGVRLTDEATCYKAFPTAALKAMGLECERFEFCPEVTAKACRLGLKILEVPIHYDPRSVRKGKKIRCSDGWQALLTLWRYRHWRPDLGRTIEPSAATLSSAARENGRKGGLGW